MRQLLSALLVSVVFTGSASAQLLVDGNRANQINYQDIQMPPVNSFSDSDVQYQQDEDGFMTLPDGAGQTGVIAGQETQEEGQGKEQKAGTRQQQNRPAQQIYRGDQKQKLEAPRTHRMYEDNNFN